MNLLIDDGWRIAQVRVIYAPEPKPSERLTWRIVCRESDRDADTEKTLALFPLPGAIVPPPPARIEKLISIFDLLNFAARRCARAFDPDKERDALAVLSEDVKCWTGTTLPDAALTGLLRLVHDELATDDEGRPPTQYFNGLDHVRLVKFVEAIATATGETVNGIRRKMLAAQVKKSFVDLPDADSIQYLAFFKTKSDSQAIPVEYYIVDDWSVEDRSRVEPHARLEPLAADRQFRAEMKALLAAHEKESAARHAELLEMIKTRPTVDNNAIASTVQRKLAPTIRAAGTKVAAEVHRIAHRGIEKAKKNTKPRDRRATYFKDEMCKILVHDGKEIRLTPHEADVVFEYGRRHTEEDKECAPFKDVCDALRIKGRKPSHVFRRNARKDRPLDVFRLIFQPCESSDSYALRIWPLTVQ